MLFARPGFGSMSKIRLSGTSVARDTNIIVIVLQIAAESDFANLHAVLLR